MLQHEPMMVSLDFQAADSFSTPQEDQEQSINDALSLQFGAPSSMDEDSEMSLSMVLPSSSEERPGKTIPSSLLASPAMAVEPMKITPDICQVSPAQKTESRKQSWMDLLQSSGPLLAPAHGGSELFVDVATNSDLGPSANMFDSGERKDHFNFLSEADPDLPFSNSHGGPFS